eukprot:4555711-Pyramimonas_sp.AAC.1
MVSHHPESSAVSVGSMSDADSDKSSRGPSRPLTMVPLAALIFYEVSGGPFGIEVNQPPCAPPPTPGF